MVCRRRGAFDKTKFPINGCWIGSTVVPNHSRWLGTDKSSNIATFIVKVCVWVCDQPFHFRMLCPSSWALGDMYQTYDNKFIWLEVDPNPNTERTCLLHLTKRTIPTHHTNHINSSVVRVVSFGCVLSSFKNWFFLNTQITWNCCGSHVANWSYSTVHIYTNWMCVGGLLQLESTCIICITCFPCAWCHSGDHVFVSWYRSSYDNMYSPLLSSRVEWIWNVGRPLGTYMHTN